MKTINIKKLALVLGLALILLAALALPVFAEGEPAEGEPDTAEAAEPAAGGISETGMKALSAALAVGLAAAAGAIAMGMATAKSAECIARQPEAEGKIRTTMMLGLVFIETAIIYALLVVILIIFVL